MGPVEEITSTYVVLKLWDWRRLILPLSYFMEKPFQNWTREGAALIASSSSLGLFRPHRRAAAQSGGDRRRLALWDRQVVNVQ